MLTIPFKNRNWVVLNQLEGAFAPDNICNFSHLHKSVMHCDTTFDIRVKSASAILALVLSSPLVGPAESKSPPLRLSNGTTLAPSAVSLVRKADAWRDHGEIEKALALYNQALKIDRGFAAAYFGRALVWEEFGKMDNALLDFGSAIKIEKPFHEKAMRLRGDLYQSLHRYEEAIKDYTMVISRRPSDGLYFSRGTCYLRLNKPAQALADYNKALALCGPRASILERRGDANFALRRDAKALADYDMTLKLDPDGDDSKDGHEHLHRCKAEIFKRAGKTNLYKIELKAAERGRNANIDIAPFTSDPVK